MPDKPAADDTSGIPAAWRVTLSWPIPVGWATANYRVQDTMPDPARRAEIFGYLYSTVKDVEVNLRPRTLAVAMTVLAEDPASRHSNAGYRTSSERAITVAVQCAQFGYRQLSYGKYQELPEPVRIAARPIARRPEEAPQCPALCPCH